MYIISASKRGRYSYHRKYEYAVRKANEEAKKMIPPQIMYMAHEIMNLASRITEMFLSCVRPTPNYYENISVKTEQYLVRFHFSFFRNIPFTSFLNENLILCQFQSIVMSNTNIISIQIIFQLIQNLILCAAQIQQFNWFK